MGKSTLERVIVHFFGTDEPERVAAVLMNMKKAQLARSLVEGAEENKKISDMRSAADRIGQSAEEFSKSEGVDLDELAENPEFMRYIADNGLSAREAYYLAARDKLNDELVKKAREELTSSILAKRGRIAENAADVSRAKLYNKKRAKDMSGAEIEDIIRRARGGEVIKF